MPLPGRSVTRVAGTGRRCAALALLAACTPAKFAWTDDGVAELAAYRQAFASAAGDGFTDAWSRSRLPHELDDVRVLWLGDHHRSTRLHAVHLQLLDELHRAGRPFVLALEAVGSQHDDDLAAFVAGRLSLDDLRTRLLAHWPGSWLDDGELDAAYYRAVLAFAQTHRVPVHGLEPTPRLRLPARDHAIVTTVRALAAADRTRLVVAVVGQSHLVGGGDVVARTGLPALVVGAEPPPALAASAPPLLAPGTLHRSSGGLWWFAEVLAR